MIPVVALTFGDQPARGYWDQGLLDALLAGALAVPAGFPGFRWEEQLPVVEGGVVVIPGSHNVEHVELINETLAALPWVVVIVTNNEEGGFPVDRLEHPRMRVWVQAAQPGQIGEGRRVLPFGWPPALPGELAAIEDLEPRGFDWSFVGQVTHERRHALVEAVEGLPFGLLTTSETFGGETPYPTYTGILARTRAVPCPSGPVNVDSFRLWEALEAGAVPVADGRTPQDDAHGYWQYACAGDVPFPVVDDWQEFPAHVERIAATWPREANRVGAWWKLRKRGLACQLADDVAHLSGASPSSWPTSLREHVTVIVPTSPIPSHPDLDVLETTLRSLWEHEQLAGCEIVVACDGVRGEQEDRRLRYEWYLHRLVRASHRDEAWRDVLPLIFDEHVHQANTTRAALELVRTPLVLFVEHDTPLVGDVEWTGLAEVLLAGDANAVRFHYDETIHPDHAYLMVGESRPIAGHRGMSSPWGVPTVQWSQRPHLARADWYRRILAEHFPETSRTMIEDLLHGVVQDAPWEEHRVWVYDPMALPQGGGMKRSTHLDGRGGDPKFDMRFE